MLQISQNTICSAILHAILRRPLGFGNAFPHLHSKAVLGGQEVRSLKSALYKQGVKLLFRSPVIPLTQGTRRRRRPETWTNLEKAPLAPAIGFSTWLHQHPTIHYVSCVIYHWPRSLAKQGDNALGSVPQSVRPFVSLCPLDIRGSALPSAAMYSIIIDRLA